MDRSDLAKRMKGYEKRNRYYLQRKIPVIVRLDMRAGHSFTKRFERPFDNVFMESMQETAKYLCENIQNCKLSYQQSDEITLLLIDYNKLKLNTDCFFDYRIDKLCSIVASMATMAFNKFFIKVTHKHFEEELRTLDNKISDGKFVRLDEISNLENKYDKYVNKFYTAMFDARCFNIPKEEVTNFIYWRQLDASRNSIQMVGQANFSHKELQNKSCNQIQDMLMEQKGINWNDFHTYQKRGSCCIKIKNKIDEGMINEQQKFGEDKVTKIVSIRKSHWIIDKEIPIFKGDNREYIDKLINVGE